MMGETERFLIFFAYTKRKKKKHKQPKQEKIQYISMNNYNPKAAPDHTQPS